MNLVQKILFGGCAVLAIAGAAWAGGGTTHHLDVSLPDGGVARISYAGDVAPKVELIPAADATTAALLDSAAFQPLFLAGFDDFDSVFADVHRQMAALSRAMEHGVPGGGISRAALQSLPPGTVSYSVVTTGDGTRSCTRSTSMTVASGNAKPQLISRTSGDCGPGTRTPGAPVTASARQHAPAATKSDRPMLVSARAPGAADRQVGHY